MTYDPRAVPLLAKEEGDLVASLEAMADPAKHRGGRPWGVEDVSLKTARRAISRLERGSRHPVSRGLSYLFQEAARRCERDGEPVRYARGLEPLLDALDYGSLHWEPLATWPLRYREAIHHLTRWLDRLISRHGPGASLVSVLYDRDEENVIEDEDDVLPDVDPSEYEREPSEEERRLHQVGTDEVRPQSDDPSDESPFHGGSGSSGEVDHVAQTQAQESRGAPEGARRQQADPNSGRSETTPAQREEPGVIEGGAVARDSSGSDDADPRGAASPVDGDDPHPEGEDAAWPSTQEAVPDPAIMTPAQAGVGGEAASPATVIPLTRSWGGRNATLRSAERRADPRGARELTRRLVRLLKAVEVSSLGDTSPRIDTKRLVRELTSRRVRLAQARRAELQPRLIVLAADVSGSCSAVCTETLAAAVSVRQVLGQDRVAVLVHSNGWPVEWEGPEALRPPLRGEHDQDEDRVLDWARSIAPRIGAVVAWGDSDAAWVYRKWVETGAKLFWLDSACKPAGVILRGARSHWHPGHWDRVFFDVTYVTGVGDVGSTSVALRLIERQRR
jgi:hypothetical protein